MSVRTGVDGRGEASTARIDAVLSLVSLMGKCLLIMVFPIVRLGGVPVVTYLPFALATYPFHKRVLPLPYILAGVGTSLYLFVMTLVAASAGETTAKDMMYPVLPLLYIIFSQAFLNDKRAPQLLVIYFYANIAVMLFEMVAPNSSIVQSYLNYAMGNVVTGTQYLETMAIRPGGLLIHPPWTGIMLYIVGKYLSIRERKKYYMVLVLLAIGLSGSRTALVAFLIVESVMYVLASKHVATLIFRITAAVVLTVAAIGVLYQLVPFFRTFMDGLIADLSNGGGLTDFSYTYRAAIVEWAWNNLGAVEFLFGGHAIGAVQGMLNLESMDNEILLRTIQFGIIGYMMLYWPLAVLYSRARKAGSRDIRRFAVFLLLLMPIATATTTVLSNVLFIVQLSIIIAICEREFARARQVHEAEDGDPRHPHSPDLSYFRRATTVTPVVQLSSGLKHSKH